MQKTGRKSGEKALRALALGLAGMLAGGVARAGLYSEGSALLGTGAPPTVVSVNDASPITVGGTVSEAVVQTNWGPGEITYPTAWISGTAISTGATHYGAIHGSVVANSSPFVAVDTYAGLPAGLSYAGVYTAARFYGTWADNWTLSGIPAACGASMDCTMKISGHLQMTSTLGAPPYSYIGDIAGQYAFRIGVGSPDAWFGGVWLDFAKNNNDGYPDPASTLYVGKWGKVTDTLFSDPQTTITGIGDPRGSRYVPWEMSFSLASSTGTLKFGLDSWLIIQAVYSGSVNAMDTGAIDSIILPAGVSLTSDSGEVVSRLDGSLGYVAAVPEPETYACFLTGLGLLAAVSRRRNSAPA